MKVVKGRKFPFLKFSWTLRQSSKLNCVYPLKFKQKMDGWIDYGKFKVFNAEQRSAEWLKERAKLCATTTDFYAILAYMEGNGEKPDRTKVVEENDAMLLGNLAEPHIRKWFKEAYLSGDSSIQELGLAVPKFYPKIGASTDGVILTSGKAVGIIEIKTTKKMYTTLKLRSEVQETLNEGSDNNVNPEEYISPWHYAQMQGCMAILGMGVCHYIVWEHTSNTMHVEKVPFDQNYWERRLYPALYYYIENGFSRTSQSQP